MRLGRGSGGCVRRVVGTLPAIGDARRSMRLVTPHVSTLRILYARQMDRLKSSYSARNRMQVDDGSGKSNTLQPTVTTCVRERAHFVKHSNDSLPYPSKSYRTHT